MISGHYILIETLNRIDQKLQTITHNSIEKELAPRYLQKDFYRKFSQKISQKWDIS